MYMYLQVLLRVPTTSMYMYLQLPCTCIYNLHVHIQPPCTCTYNFHVHVPTISMLVWLAITVLFCILYLNSLTSSGLASLLS